MAVIGRLLVDYGELELDLMNCIQVARSFDLNATLKAMFRVRGETNRIDIADGLSRAAYVAVNLTAEFDAMIAALKHCLRTNRTCRFPASGSRARPHAFTHGTSCPSLLRRTSPKCP
jgi:hypothetical protein